MKTKIESGYELVKENKGACGNPSCTCKNCTCGPAHNCGTGN
ncbi:MAG TPA: hypothetical protein VM012_00615 [Flavitalea sp.]|nr:hypothetical protein [Flavitalea sp.]